MPHAHSFAKAIFYDRLRMFIFGPRKSKNGTLLAVLLGVLCAMYMFSAGGCDSGSTQVVKETSEPHFLRGQEELRRGNDAEAMSAFLKVIEKRKDAPESHLEVGRLSLDKMNDPIQAIYHFRKYLESKPNSQASQMVRSMIETAQKKFAASLPESPFDSNIKRMELEEIVSKLRTENLELKQKLAASIENYEKLEALSRAAIPAPKVSADSSAAQASKRSNSNVRSAESVQLKTQRNTTERDIVVKKDTPSSYVVKPGDTLSSISRKVYGKSSRWKEIYNANRDRLVSPEALKVGQSLRIPK